MVVLIICMLIGIVAIGLFIRALVKKRGWSLLRWLLGLLGIFAASFILFVVGTLVADIPTATEVEVELKEWEVNAQPATVKSGQHPFKAFGGQKIIFKIINTGSMTHEFAVVRTNVAPDNLPIEGQRVRYYTYAEEGEPRMGFFLCPGTVQYSTLRGFPPPEIGGMSGSESILEPSQDLGILIAPGETKSFTIGSGKQGWSPGTTFVLFSNQPGDYECGMYTRFTITDPPFINTYWWVVLISAAVVGLLIYLLAIRVRRRE